MSPRIFATLLALLAGTGVALGQSQPAQPAPTPPAQSPALETLPNPTPLGGMPGDLMSPPVVPVAPPAPDVGPPAGWVFQGAADMVLWFSPTVRNPTFATAPNLAGTVVPGGSATLGDENISHHMIPGARVSLGYWWMEDNPWTPGRKLPMAGYEARFLVVGQRTATQTENTSPTLVRPFYDINDAANSAVIIAEPGLATGGISTR